MSHPIVQELSPLTDWFFSNSFFYLIVNTALPLIDYFTTVWWSIMFVIAFPEFLIVALAEDWDLRDTGYSPYLYSIGVDWLQYMWISGGINKKIEYHYMAWCGYLSKKDWFLKVVMMIIRDAVDIFWVLTIPLGFFLLAIPNMWYVIGWTIYMILNRTQELEALNDVLLWIGYEEVFSP